MATTRTQLEALAVAERIAWWATAKARLASLLREGGMLWLVFGVLEGVALRPDPEDSLVWRHLRPADRSEMFWLTMLFAGTAILMGVFLDLGDAARDRVAKIEREEDGE